MVNVNGQKIPSWGESLLSVIPVDFTQLRRSQKYIYIASSCVQMLNAGPYTQGRVRRRGELVAEFSCLADFPAMNSISNYENLCALLYIEGLSDSLALE